MTQSSISPVRDCVRFAPGHSVHWIQARLVRTEPQPCTAIEVVHVDDRYLVLAADDGLRRFANHDLPRVQAIVSQHGPLGALVGHHLLRFESGHLVCVKEDVEGLLEACSRALA